jgi:hypothetical protein
MVVACTPAAGEPAADDATDAPTDDAAATGAPATAVPATEAPATEAPATNTPATEAPGGTPANGAGLSSGEVPQELFDAVVADALARSGAERSSVSVQTSEQVEWSDGSLGCPAPDMMYTQAIVPGYHVILDVGGTTYDYRLSDSGLIILCENGLPVMPGG